MQPSQWRGRSRSIGVAYGMAAVSMAMYGSGNGIVSTAYMAKAYGSLMPTTPPTNNVTLAACSVSWQQQHAHQRSVA